MTLFEECIGALGNGLDAKVYLLWNYSDAMAVISELQTVLNVIDDVTAVGSDTWIYNPSLGYVIEFYHEGQVTVGFRN